MRTRQNRRKPLAVVTTTVPISMDRFQRPLIRQLKELGYDVMAVSSRGAGLQRSLGMKPSSLAPYPWSET